ncbi:uncharacterized protein FIBRA_09268 [Fibroporia radiculosa]|uniref:HTH CENPB-type domain-containing protein n=1 Tax=Fibroporia radiculosa TaxID=599839 RepID=J7S676_9APHY|nr:uncharacterized protein FIBRA_09268 [Fibroporia radiculosa]CCM06954.1 predicted protein [Fibroporia radiculosa]
MQKDEQVVFTDSLIITRAKEIWSRIIHNPLYVFKASSTWVRNFKRRHGIRGGKICRMGETQIKLRAFGQQFTPFNGYLHDEWDQVIEELPSNLEDDTRWKDPSSALYRATTGRPIIPVLDMGRLYVPTMSADQPIYRPVALHPSLNAQDDTTSPSLQTLSFPSRSEPSPTAEAIKRPKFYMTSTTGIKAIPIYEDTDFAHITPQQRRNAIPLSEVCAHNNSYGKKSHEKPIMFDPARGFLNLIPLSPTLSSRSPSEEPAVSPTQLSSPALRETSSDYPHSRNASSHTHAADDELLAIPCTILRSQVEIALNPRRRLLSSSEKETACRIDLWEAREALDKLLDTLSRNNIISVRQHHVLCALRLKLSHCCAT